MADPLDLVHLRTLVAIAETGGFRRAADSLHLSQPTVSQHVRLLEKRLKQSLVVKDGRGSRFTAAGGAPGPGGPEVACGARRGAATVLDGCTGQAHHRFHRTRRGWSAA
ncbi:LysR family transcriptional regulator [Williamsia sp. DF01-3]|uniref:helix-turn-helix domain-containing protein n=1 Tax=Williamsia sp. DF01-3 TaxID=2934157 RepID=UPI001FF48DAC|nr:LysR family transcriptional regulator [Williamsia sp. DF01-3]MCK0517601.1 LysR family transcriptional regulator [Williamsia sp. DF01-3]